MIVPNGYSNQVIVQVNATSTTTAEIYLNGAMSFGASNLEAYNKYSFTATIINKGNTSWKGAFYLKSNGYDVASWGGRTIGPNQTITLNGYYTPTSSGTKQIELFYQTNEIGAGPPVKPNGYSNPLSVSVKTPTTPPTVVTPTVPSITISNANPTDGDKVRIEGSGFTPNKTSKLLITNSSKSTESNPEVSANSSGNVSYDYHTTVLGAGTISISGYDPNKKEYTKTQKIIVKPKETALNSGNLVLLSPTPENDYINLPHRFNISWRDLLSKKNLNKYYKPNPGKSGEFFYSYTVEYKTSANGAWTKFTNGDVKGSTSPEKTFNENVNFEAFATEYFKIRIRDNYLQTNVDESSVFKLRKIDSSLDISLDWDRSYESTGVTVKGVAADGVARIYVKVKNKNLDKISARVTDPNKP